MFGLQRREPSLVGLSDPPTGELPQWEDQASEGITDEERDQIHPGRSSGRG